MSTLIPTAAATAAISSGVKMRFIGCPMTTPSSTSTGATNRATCRLEPKVTAMANSILSLAASWTATRCSARLPMVGMSTTPTKNALRPNESMNGSMAPTRISERMARSPAAASRTTMATLPLQAGPACPSGSPWPPRVSWGLENWYTSDTT